MADVSTRRRVLRQSPHETRLCGFWTAKFLPWETAGARASFAASGERQDQRRNLS
jgi:hypothetical protein